MNLRLVPDVQGHQYKEDDGVLPGTLNAPCRHCGEGVGVHIARQCAAGVSGVGERCERDATYVVPWSGRRLPFCGQHATRLIDVAIVFGLDLCLEPIAPRGVA